MSSPSNEKLKEDILRICYCVLSMLMRYLEFDLFADDSTHLGLAMLSAKPLEVRDSPLP